MPAFPPLIQTFSHPSSPFFPALPKTPVFSYPKPRLRLLSSLPTSFPYSLPHPTENPNHSDGYEDDVIVGDCLVFDEGAFDEDDPFINPISDSNKQKKRRPSFNLAAEPQDLVPEKWKQAVEEINLTKKEKRKIAYQLKFGSKMERHKPTPLPDIEEYRAYREMKLAQLNPVVLDDSKEFEPEKEAEPALLPEPGVRVLPKNPRSELKDGSLEDITDFFNSGKYVPLQKDDDKSPKGRQKLVTNEEKILLNRKIPDLSIATSSKWLPLHILAASGEFYLLDKLLKHNVDINSVDKSGLTAIHKAILCKKQAIISYLLRNSANPFALDEDGATLMHYAVRTASSETIKILLLYNVDINLSDNDGWTPLHVAVQAQRTDIVKLLLIKGADKSLKNIDGLTPLELCLYSGHNLRTYELIKLLKTFPSPKAHP